jgi:hypothetical protein
MTKGPKEYELLVRDLLQARLTSDGLHNQLKMEQNAHFTGKSGHDHQIDVAAEIKLAGIKLLILVECKYYSKVVGIDEVMEFAARIEDIGAHKGIVVTTRGFQKGAFKMAKSKGIALVVACDLHWEICCESPMREIHLHDSFVSKVERLFDLKGSISKDLRVAYHESAEAGRGERLTEFGVSTGDHGELDGPFQSAARWRGERSSHGYVFTDLDEGIRIETLAGAFRLGDGPFLAVRNGGLFLLTAMSAAS